MARLLGFLRLALLLVLAASFGSALAREAMPQVAFGNLPLEARQTLKLIKQGGPFPYNKDGSVFGNYEKALSPRPRGYYREYTVPTPGARNRGAQRIIAGRDGEYFYTADHYRSFRRIRE